MVETTFRQHLASALAALADEMPSLYTRMVGALGGREVLLVIDGESVAICFAGGDALLPAARSPSVTCVTTTAAILALVAGRTSVEDAIWRDWILLRGGVADLLAFHDGLMAYLHGAVRSPSFPARLERFSLARRDCGEPRALEVSLLPPATPSTGSTSTCTDSPSLARS